MELTESAKVLIEYNKWRRVQIRENDYIRNNISDAIKKMANYVLWNQDDKALKPHVSIFSEYLDWRSGKLEELSVGFSTKIGESIDFLTKYILENTNDKKCV